VLAEPIREKTPAALVAAHSKMLAILSGDIAAAIQALAETAHKGTPEPKK
jgi:hypothetical protein